MKPEATKILLALLGCAVGTALSFALGLALDLSPTWRSYAFSAILPLLMSLITLDTKHDGKLNWPLYFGKTVLLSFVFVAFMCYFG